MWWLKEREPSLWARWNSDNSRGGDGMVTHAHRTVTDVKKSLTCVSIVCFVSLYFSFRALSGRALILAFQNGKSSFSTQCTCFGGSSTTSPQYMERFTPLDQNPRIRSAHWLPLCAPQSKEVRVHGSHEAIQTAQRQKRGKRKRGRPKKVAGGLVREWGRSCSFSLVWCFSCVFTFAFVNRVMSPSMPYCCSYNLLLFSFIHYLVLPLLYNLFILNCDRFLYKSACTNTVHAHRRVVRTLAYCCWPFE